MNRFENDLKQAARSKNKTMAIGTLAVIALSLILSGYFLSFRSVSILVKPDQVTRLSSITIINGAALSFGQRIYSISDHIELNLSAPKYEDVNLSISDANFGTKITVTLFPKPGALEAKVKPLTNVNWYINDQFIDQSKTLNKKLAPGDYRLAVKSKFHETVEQIVTINAAEDTTIAITIPVITGKLKASMTPPGKIRVDGAVIDISKPIELGPGPHKIEVLANGYQSITDTIIVQQHERQFIRSYALKPKPLIVQHHLQPKGGDLFINGKLKKTINNSLSIPYNDTINIRYTKPGFLSKQQSLTVMPGENISLKIELEPQFGDVKIRANVSAEVYLDGQPSGLTPLQILLPTLPTTLELRADGYQTESQIITPTANNTQSHMFTLVTQKAAKIRNAKSRYTTATGIEMLFFQPKGARYSMGGARSESGQRANEFIRQIELKRPFYVATHELTQRQFYTKGSNLPLVNVTWDKVAIYCNTLSQQEGLIPFYKTENDRVIGFHADSNGYRLISEAEWEFLARAHKRAKQTIFPWGDKPLVPPKSGNLAGEKAKSNSETFIAGYQDGFSASAPPKSFPADKSGLYDMIGNVSEWTHDSYSFEPPRSGDIETDPLSRFNTAAHVVKGSNFNSATRTELRAAFREGSNTPRNDVGFRIARYL